LKRFDRTTAIVTGAAGGIGSATCMRLASEGARVAAFDLSALGLQSVVKAISTAGYTAAGHTVDVTQGDQFNSAVARVIDEWSRVDFLVNNAGITNSPASITDGTEEEFDRVIATNLKSVWVGMRAVLGHMRSKGGGAIVNVASTAGLIGYENKSPYVAAKHGVVGLTKTAALECLDVPIRINCVCPAPVDTPMIRAAFDHLPPDEAAAALRRHAALQPLRRYGTPDEIAALILFLLSSDASFITGASYIVDGGLLAGH
jgi:NAD(P)-dependent dehydrogenase (short-subunit alcohol dehydrogenase family)